MANGFAVVVVLKADVSTQAALVWIGPAIYFLAVDANDVGVGDAGDLVLVPLADGLCIGDRRGGEGVDGSRAPRRILRIRIADLHFVSFVDGQPGIVVGMGETQKHAGVGDFLLLKELAAKNEIVKLAAGKPPEPHATFSRGNAIFHDKSTRAALLPVRQGFAGEKGDKAGFAMGARKLCSSAMVR